MQSLKEELRDYDEQLPCWSAELAAAEEWAQQVDSEADAAEAEHRQLTEELSEMRLTSISPASSACEKDFEAAVGHHQKMGIAHDDFEEPLPIPPSTSDGLNLDEHRRHVDRHLQQEVSRRKLAVAHLRQQHLVSADQALAAGRKEAEELREALELAEREGQELARQRQVRGRFAVLVHDVYVSKLVTHHHDYTILYRYGLQKETVPERSHYH